MASSLGRTRRNAKSFYILIAVLATWFGSFTLISANAACGMVAPIFCPILINAGLSPKLAATSIIAGAWGTIIHPGDINASQLNLILQEHCPEIQPTYVHLIPALLGILTIVIVLSINNTAKKKKTQDENKPISAQNNSSTSFLRSMTPFLPFFILSLFGFISIIFHLWTSRNRLLLFPFYSAALYPY